VAYRAIWGNGVDPPSDTVKPHIRPFPGRLGHPPGAGCRQRRATGDFFLVPPSDAGPQPGLACFQGYGLDGLAGACVQHAGGRVKDEDDLLLAQVPGHVLGSNRGPDVDSAAGAPPPLSSGGLGEQHMKGGQVRDDEVLADVSVLRMLWAGRAGGGVAVAAPVGGLAVRPQRPGRALAW
jgi:hypothetical protein